MTEPDGMSIGELARRCNVTPRTIRYYTAEGLLPEPSRRGRMALYGTNHEIRLKLVRLLQDWGMPLEKIRQKVRWLSDKAQVQMLKEVEAASKGDSVTGIRSILGSSSRRDVLDRAHSVLAIGIKEPIPTGKEPRPRGSSLWRRVEIAPGIELHYVFSGNSRKRALIEKIASELQTRLRHMTREMKGEE